MTERARTILVVDDDSDLLDMVQMVLEGSGYRTIGFSSGADALQFLAAEPVDLILLDMMMPAMDGWTFRREQLSSPSAAHIPVVVFTGDDRAEEKAVEVTASGYVKKPVCVANLLKVVANALRPGP